MLAFEYSLLNNLAIPFIVFRSQPETLESILKMFTAPERLGHFLVLKRLLPQFDYSTFEVLNVSFSCESSLILIQQFKLLCCSLESKQDCTLLLLLHSRLCVCQ